MLGGREFREEVVEFSTGGKSRYAWEVAVVFWMPERYNINTYCNNILGEERICG